MSTTDTPSTHDPNAPGYSPSLDVLKAIYTAQQDTLEAAVYGIVDPTIKAGGGGPHVMMQLEVVVANILALFVPPDHFATVATTLHTNVLNRLAQHLLAQEPAQGSA